MSLGTRAINQSALWLKSYISARRTEYVVNVLEQGHLRGQRCRSLFMEGEIWSEYAVSCSYSIVFSIELAFFTYTELFVLSKVFRL